MDESSEKRRERLRAMREEASMVDANGVVSPLGNTLVPCGLPPLSDMQPQQQQLLLSSLAPRFEFYTDPLAAYGATQRKKSRSSCGSPFSPQPKFSPSQISQPSFKASNSSGAFGIRSPKLGSNVKHNPCPMSTSPQGYTFNPTNNHESGLLSIPWITVTTSSNINPQYTNHSLNHSSVTKGSHHYSSMMIPGGLSAHSSVHRSNSESSGHRRKSTPYDHNEPGYHVPTRSGDKGKFSAYSPQSHASGSNNGSAHHYGSSHSWGSLRQSPGSNNKAIPVRTGGKGFQRPYGKPIGEILAKRSMLEDPWKDLVPVRIESVAVRLDACSISSSHEWLPKSVIKKAAPTNIQDVSIPASGPSLVESLAASFADAIAREDNC